MNGTRFKVDENLPQQVATALVASGYDALSVRDQALTGAADPRIASVCRSEGRALVTLDLDFADIRTYPPEDHPGIIVLRLARQDREHVLGVVHSLVPMLEIEPLRGHLWIVDEDNVRIHGGTRHP